MMFYLAQEANLILRSPAATIVKPRLIAPLAHPECIVRAVGVATNIVPPPFLSPHADGATVLGGSLIAGMAHPECVVGAVRVAAGVGLGRWARRQGGGDVPPVTVTLAAHLPGIMRAVGVAASVGLALGVALGLAHGISFAYFYILPRGDI
jgi:hypothetical protein